VGAPASATPAPGALPDATAVSTAVLTVPNAISFGRLVLMPVAAWLLAKGAWAAGLGLTAVLGATDWVDGWLARRTGTVSRVGQLLDPLADRLLIASVAVALLVRGVLPWPAVALLVGRDILLLSGFGLLAGRGVRPPDVIWLGKATTFTLLVALPLLALGETGLGLGEVWHLLGMVLLWVGVVGYWVTGAIYMRTALLALRDPRGAAGPLP
jgi:cardiolipin synthase (CMP-forming)